MKRVINRKLYDTDKAENIGNWGNGFSNTDFQYQEEQLYKTKSGGYFLVSKNYNDKKMEVLSDTETMDWLEKREDAETFLEEFPSTIVEG